MTNHHSRRVFFTSFGLTLVVACSAEFTYEPCPPGQWADNSDEGVCRPCEAGTIPDLTNGGCKACDMGYAPDEKWQCVPISPENPGGAGGSGGSGGGGGMVPIPPGFDCAPGTTKCASDAQQTCGDDGKWGEAVGCEVACDVRGAACAVPVQLAAGTGHTCARLNDGTVRCWGSGTQGQLGNGAGTDSAVPVPVADIVDATSIVANDSSSCAVHSDGTVSCWGNTTVLNDSGAPYLKPAKMEGAQGVSKLGMMAYSACIIKENGSLECKGANDSGQLGNNGGAASAVFAPTSGFPSPPVRVSASVNTSLGSGTAQGSYAGGTACAVLADGTVACWGKSNCGQNGGTSPTLVANDVRDIREVFVGDEMSCAVRNDGNLFCWGGNYAGQLGRGTSSSNPLHRFGEPAALIPNFGGVVKVSIGFQHVCATRSDNTLWCWGEVSLGRLGFECGEPETETACSAYSGSYGSAAFIPSPAQVPLQNVADVAAGSAHTCALTGDGKVYCWGSNASGQLGNGSIGSSRSAPAAIVWKNLEQAASRVHLGKGGGRASGGCSSHSYKGTWLT